MPPLPDRKLGFDCAWCRGTLLTACVALALTPSSGHAQTATPTLEENFRAGPNGAILAQVFPGAVLAVRGEEGSWIRAELSGWVWEQSLQRTDRNGFDLVVSVGEGENIRIEPQGTRLGRLQTGTLLEEIERRPGWVRVRRVGWIWGASVRREEAAETPSPVEAEVDARESSSLAITVPSAGVTILAGPNGDTLAAAEPGTDLLVLAQEGGWVRVRVEGWVWLPSDLTALGDSAAVPVDVTPEAVLSEPDRYAGRLVTWTLQFISLEQAENVRTGFYRGEPFLLTRSGPDQGTFVYVAVPPERLDEVRGLTALERIEVLGRIRQGASSLTGSPIVELVELRPAGRL